jgi:DNA-binding MarR family transcriptional regulator
VPLDDVLPALEAELAALWRRGRATARAAAHALHPQLDPTAYPLVLVLGQQGALRMSELGERLQLDKSTLSRQVDAAARTGLVERTVDPFDARARLVDLTDAGRTALSRVRAQQRAAWERSLTGWTRDEVVTLTALLAKLDESGVG